VFVSRVAGVTHHDALALGRESPARVLHVDGRCCWRRCPSPTQRRQLGIDHWSRSLSFTLHRESDILTELEKVAKRGWALNDQELEIGLRAVAATDSRFDGPHVAAINISTPVGRRI